MLSLIWDAVTVMKESLSTEFIWVNSTPYYMIIICLSKGTCDFDGMLVIVW